MSSLNQQRDEKKRSCIDLVDSLRSLGLEQDVGLPALAVIGDQGSGKSSVLEALSGVTLPRGRKQPLVLKMKRTKDGDNWYGKMTCQINEEIREQKTIHNPVYVSKVYKEVQPSRWYKEGFFTLEISSPDVPNLTLIDLPSIPTEKSDKVKSLIETFLSKQITLNLVVIPCNVDIGTTEALNMALEADPKRAMTLGILTKPDLVDKDKEKAIVDIVQNKFIPLKKGYMMVRCWDQSVSVTDAINKERAFFKDHPLFKPLYEDGCATVPKLSERLSLELRQQVEKSLPQLKDQIKKSLLQANAELQRYVRGPPSSEADKHTFLTDTVTAFTQQATSFLTGELLELIEQKIFSEWRDIVDNSREIFYINLEEEVSQYEQKHSDKIQSGFINYNTFESMIKTHIKLLEGPAVLTLKNATEMIKEELQSLLENSFGAFSNFISETKRKICQVISVRHEAAESILVTQFKMELFVHTGDGMCRQHFDNIKKEDQHVISSNSCAILDSMANQLKSNYNIVCQRLSGQIPLLIRFQMLQELGAQIQTEMNQILQNKPDTGALLKEDYCIKEKRKKSQKDFMRLRKAWDVLPVTVKA